MHHGNVTPQIAAGLLALKKRVDAAKIPPSKLDETINIAIWNVREFGKVHRTEAAVHYIAEIIGQFDLVALVELRNDLTDLGRVMKYLGESWKVVFSDWTDDRGGNDERTAFLFDRRAVTHNGLAAEIDAPRVKKGDEWVTEESFWRPPYLCAFRAGNFDFLAIAMHARWGDTDAAGLAARRDELALLSNWIKRRFKHKYVEDHDLLVLGDFNTPDITGEIFKALTAGGLVIPKPLVDLQSGTAPVVGSNLGKDKRYDQILHVPTLKENFVKGGGVLDFFVGEDAGIEELFPGKGYDRDKFTYQMSDHLPVWIQVKTDIEGFRLEQIIRSSKE